ncbi:histidine phosphatase family protein [Rhodobacteraceae bacterium KMM 6894]|nr:histidine phosphatase family protein [Rhodobacteraceae bacterium KMM 6894]
MTEIVLVRHGQANSHATDEVGYDRLSDLGRAQAGWLGHWLGETDPHFDQVITGTLLRQRQTAEAMGQGNGRADARLNELSFFALAQALEAQHGIPAPREATEFARYLPEVIAHWAEDRLTGVPESFAQFSDRITALIDEVCTGHGRVLLVTSGGVIGMVMRQVLGLSEVGMAKVMLGTMNSSLHRLHHAQGALMLGTYNATPHLDSPDRVHARTFI